MAAIRTENCHAGGRHFFRPQARVITDFGGHRTVMGCNKGLNSRAHFGTQEEFMAHKAGSKEKPNILVIWGDDIGISNISAYSDGLMGYETPDITFGEFEHEYIS
jgi:hypothetical protein